MEFTGKRSKTAVSGLLPEYGAIFMSNTHTKKECLRKQLFGLPSSFSEFVRNVKTGMVLFLFEYEQRRLYGVFEAASDGEIDILPSAYGSSGKRFPAQVRVKRIWNCDPLSEHEFSVAIKDNYFGSKKFHFGLSKYQVQQLLHLFSSRKISRDLNLFTLREFRSIRRRPSRNCDSGTSITMDAVSGLQEVTETSCCTPQLSSLKHSSSSQISQMSVNLKMRGRPDHDSEMMKVDKSSNAIDDRGELIPLSVPSDNETDLEVGRLLPLDDRTKFAFCEMCEDEQLSDPYIPLPVPIFCDESSERITAHQGPPIGPCTCTYHTIVDPSVPMPVFHGKSSERITAHQDYPMGSCKCTSPTAVVESSYDAKQGKPGLGCQELCDAGEGQGNPSNSMKHLHCETGPRERKSVFSRLNFASKEKQEDNSDRVDKFMNEIMEELQLTHDLRSGTNKDANSVALAGEGTNLSEKSVFLRLGARPSKSRTTGQKRLYSNMDAEYMEFMQMHSLEWDEVTPSACL